MLCKMGSVVSDGAEGGRGAAGGAAGAERKTRTPHSDVGKHIGTKSAAGRASLKKHEIFCVQLIARSLSS